MDNNSNNFQQNPKNNSTGIGFSVSSLVLGLSGILLLFVLGFFSGIFGAIVGAICGILSIIFGYKGREISSALTGTASGMATAGFVLGIISLVLSTVGTISCASCVGCSVCATNGLLGYPYIF